MPSSLGQCTHVPSAIGASRAARNETSRVQTGCARLARTVAVESDRGEARVGDFERGLVLVAEELRLVEDAREDVA